MQQIYYSLQPFTIKLRAPFGTSHSVTNQRTNALLKVTILGTTGMAEIGLPPKKENCYFTDFQDVENFINNIPKDPLPDYDGFNEFKDTPYFQLGDYQHCDILNQELSKIDQIPQNNINLACRALVECALLDWFAKINNTQISKILSLKNHQRLSNYELRNFFTLSLFQDPAQVIQQIEQGLHYTNNFKIKVGSDLNYIHELLSGFYTLMIKDKQYHGLISIDCNCSWTPEIAVEFLQLLNKELLPIKPYVYMIEQPYPIVFDQDWRIVKQLYIENNIDIYADESIKTYTDVELCQSVSTGVNIKIEKSGGYRGAVKNMMTASALGLKKWVGIMVGSSLNCNQAVSILGFSDIAGDIDGPLLVEQESHIVDSIFDWATQETVNWGKVKLINN